MSDERLTQIEIALAYDRRMIDELNTELYTANQEIAVLKGKVERLERAMEQLIGQIDGPPPNEKPPHY